MTFDITTEYFNDVPDWMSLLGAFGWIVALAVLIFGAVIAVDGDGMQKVASVPIFAIAIVLVYLWISNFGAITDVQEQRDIQFREVLLDNGLVNAEIDQVSDTFVAKRVSDDRFFECATIPQVEDNKYKVVCV